MLNSWNSPQTPKSVKVLKVVFPQSNNTNSSLVPWHWSNGGKADLSSMFPSSFDYKSKHWFWYSQIIKNNSRYQNSMNSSILRLKLSSINLSFVVNNHNLVNNVVWFSYLSDATYFYQGIIWPTIYIKLKIFVSPNDSLHKYTLKISKAFKPEQVTIIWEIYKVIYCKFYCI